MASSAKENNARIARLETPSNAIPPKSNVRIQDLLHFVMPGYFYLPVSLWDTKSNKRVPNSTDLPD